MNETYPNVTVTLGLSRKVILTNLVTISIALCNAFFQCIGLATLMACKRMPMQIKYLSCNNLISELLISVNIVITSIALLIGGQQHFELMFYLRLTLTTVIVSIAWATIAGLTLERLLALSMTMTFVSMINMRNIGLLIVTIWVVNLVIPLIINIVTYETLCSWQFDTCDMDLALLPLRITTAILLTVYVVFVIIAYIKISKIVRRHTRNIQKQIAISVISLSDLNLDQNKKRSLKEKSQSRKEKSQQAKEGNYLSATQMIIGVVLWYILLHAPILLHTLIFSFILLENQYQVFFQIMSYSCATINCYVNLYWYIFKMKECKMIFIKKFLWWNKKFADYSESLRLDVYDIVIAERSKSTDT